MVLPGMVPGNTGNIAFKGTAGQFLKHFNICVLTTLAVGKHFFLKLFAHS